MDNDPFPVVDVDQWRWAHLEPMGKPGKRWLEDPDGRLWLWKPVTEQREVVRTFVKGEDWAEKIGAELARHLGVSAADAELARRGGERGVILATVAPAGRALVHGNELLAAVVVQYPKDDRQEISDYTLDNVGAAFDHFSVGAPEGAASPDALSAFVGYLALDALIGNTDRHHLNWGVLRHVEDGRLTLCPSFDHATSLGFQLSDDARARHLDTPGGIKRYAARGRSRPFAGRPLLTDLLIAGLQARPDARDAIADAFAHLSVDAVHAIVERVPADTMSQLCRTFVTQLLIVNQERVLDACNDDRP
jgi:hypothetical protein